MTRVRRAGQHQSVIRDTKPGHSQFFDAAPLGAWRYAGAALARPAVAVSS